MDKNLDKAITRWRKYLAGDPLEDALICSAYTILYALSEDVAAANRHAQEREKALANFVRNNPENTAFADRWEEAYNIAATGAYMQGILRRALAKLRRETMHGAARMPFVSCLLDGVEFPPHHERIVHFAGNTPVLSCKEADYGTEVLL